MVGLHALQKQMLSSNVARTCIFVRTTILKFQWPPPPAPPLLKNNNQPTSEIKHVFIILREQLTSFYVADLKEVSTFSDEVTVNTQIAKCIVKVWGCVKRDYVSYLNILSRETQNVNTHFGRSVKIGGINSGKTISDFLRNTNPLVHT